MSMKIKIASPVLAAVLVTAAMGSASPAFAGNAGAFIGGVLATKILGNMEERTEAENRQAAAAERMAERPRSASAPSASQSAEARIAELDKLAAGGYITPEEYKAKKKAILDSI